MGNTFPVISSFQLIKLKKNTTSVTLTVYNLHPLAIPHSNKVAQQSLFSSSRSTMGYVFLSNKKSCI